MKAKWQIPISEMSLQICKKNSVFEQVCIVKNLFGFGYFYSLYCQKITLLWIMFAHKSLAKISIRITSSWLQAKEGMPF
jgi:hypothetical protein